MGGVRGRDLREKGTCTENPPGNHEGKRKGGGHAATIERTISPGYSHRTASELAAMDRGWGVEWGLVRMREVPGIGNASIRAGMAPPRRFRGVGEARVAWPLKNVSTGLL